MQKIVIGFDGSDQARDGLALGGGLAGALGADLVVAAAFGPMLAGAGVDLHSIERDYFDSVFAKAEGELAGVAFERRELRDVSAPRGLDRLAETEHVDLIVVGPSHRSPAGRVMFGSTGERLLYGAPCPVGVAPRGYADEADRKLKRIGVAYDGTEESKLALAEARELAAAVEGELHLITVIYEWLYVPETSSSHSLEEFMDREREEHREIQRQAIEAVGDAVGVEAVLEEGHDPVPILLAAASNLDLLVIGSRGYGPVRRTLLGGVSAPVMRDAPCPVIVVPRAARAED
jgi:nucleotide-binding universal stress UspA family protein